ncbi:unnamed protein product [Urochloa humidicola]
MPPLIDGPNSALPSRERPHCPPPPPPPPVAPPAREKHPSPTPPLPRLPSSKREPWRCRRIQEGEGKGVDEEEAAAAASMQIGGRRRLDADLGGDAARLHGSRGGPPPEAITAAVRPGLAPPLSSFATAFLGDLGAPLIPCRLSSPETAGIEAPPGLAIRAAPLLRLRADLPWSPGFPAVQSPLAIVSSKEEGLGWYSWLVAARLEKRWRGTERIGKGCSFGRLGAALVVDLLVRWRKKGELQGL